MKKILSISALVICLASCTDGNEWEGRIPVSAEFYNENQQIEGDHEYVDLGLPSGTLWATIDIGATSPSCDGLLFSWGDREGYKESEHEFEFNNYKFYVSLGNHEYIYSKYIISRDYGKIDNLTRIEKNDDAAYVLWGKEWHIPTKDQIEELLNNCTVRTTLLEGQAGYEFIGKNGNSIFMKNNHSRWSSDMCTFRWGERANDHSYSLVLLKNQVILHGMLRSNGNYIRPVR